MTIYKQDPNGETYIRPPIMTAEGHDFANGWHGNLQLPTAASVDATLSRSGASTPSPLLRSGIVAFSGGSAANNLVEIFNQVREANDTTLSYVIPISDNGGSSSELIRVFGGPGEKLRPIPICVHGKPDRAASTDS